MSAATASSVGHSFAIRQPPTADQTVGWIAIAAAIAACIGERQMPARAWQDQISTGRHSASSSCASSTSMSASLSGTLVSNPFSEYRITCMSLSSSSALVANTCAGYSFMVQMRVALAQVAIWANC